MTDSPRHLTAVEALIQSLLGEYQKAEFIRLDLKYVAAPTARQRALELVGQSAGPNAAQMAQRMLGGGQPEQPGPGPQQPSLPHVDNLGDRLTVDPSGNALIFRGLAEEIEQVRSILAIIDTTSNLKPKRYEAGASAKQLADIAKQRGLGEVTTIKVPNQNQDFNYWGGGYPQQVLEQFETVAVGPVMVVDEANGSIIYYGTDEQHEQLAELIETLDIQSEAVVIRAYTLHHADAEKVAELLLGLIQNQTPAGTSPLLPGGTTGSGPAGAQPPVVYRGDFGGQPGMPGQSGEGMIDADAFVLADKANNQVLVKARAKQQEEFERLIAKLDLRRPQVYIEAKIVAVTWSDELRLAFETQIINAAGTGGVFNSNFGLASFATGVPLTAPKAVATGLAGLTAALIKSDQVPVVMNALAKDGNTRIVSSPSLLVDSNEEAKVVSVDQQPTTTTTQSTGNPAQTSFGQYVDAGTELTVKPQISEGGYLRLKYETKLSSFTGTGAGGVPPPKQENSVKADSVTVPSDMTVVVGGLSFNSDNKTVAKIPLLGDIPVIGALFSDQSKTSRRVTLYVFLTPRILRDPGFNDLRLVSSGPQSAAGLTESLPLLEARYVDAFEVTPTGGAASPGVEPAGDRARPSLELVPPRGGG